MYKFVISDAKESYAALKKRYENALVDRFIASSPVSVAVTNEGGTALHGTMPALAGDVGDERRAFLQALYDCEAKQFNSALAHYDIAASAGTSQGVEAMYEAFYLMNRGVLRAEMIDFIASMENNVQVLSMDESGNTRARIKGKVSTSYDYSQAIADMKRAGEIAPGVAYILYNLGNLYCLSSDHIASIAAYTKAIAAYPYMGDAYFNRALVQIYLRDKEKGCNDLSVAGELGVAQAYSIIKKYCEKDEIH